ncbi:SH3 domain-containing protein [Streptomyces botrytidirepellens]|uniref:SH3 domain-containing protein n=1 Tax=Streptomyces botrytidirepellens TaxID=2486417 RepID=UPI0011CEA968|nr:SH3 domain-containing protein [Streptomyces botrytidirepellens]
MSITKSMAVLAATLGAGTALLLAPTAATAQTSDAEGILSCSHAWSNQDPDGSDPKTITRNAVNVRSGPHAAAGTTCGVVGSLNSGDEVFYHCYTTTQNEGTWTHLRKNGTSLDGWVKDTLLPRGGSNYPC